MNHLISLIKNHSDNEEIKIWFCSIEINDFGTVSEIIGQNPIADYTFDFSSFYNEEIYEPIRFDFVDEIEYERAISYEKEIIDALSSDIEPNSSEEIELMVNFSLYVEVSKDLIKVKELANKIYEKIFKNVGINDDNRRNYRDFLVNLVYSNLKNNGDIEKAMDNLFEVLLDDIEDILFDVSILDVSGISSDTAFWMTIERLRFNYGI